MATSSLWTSGVQSPLFRTNGASLAPASSSIVRVPSFPIFPKIHASNTRSPFSLLWRRREGTTTAFVNHGSVLTKEESGGVSGSGGSRKEIVPCELYVCNLPRSCDIPQLLEIFQPYGTVISVEVSKNPETGVSKGCGYVTMGSKAAAKKAIQSLDGTDVQGREMRVKFSVEMTPGRSINRDMDVAYNDSLPVKAVIYESPYKLYVGNLPWTLKPDELRKKFSQYGNVVSVRVLYDRKGGRNRAYGFVSFSTESERQASLILDGTDLYGRALVVRMGLNRQDLPNPLQ